MWTLMTSKNTNNKIIIKTDIRINDLVSLHEGLRYQINDLYAFLSVSNVKIC